VDGSDAHYTFLVYKPGESRDVPVFRNGNVATPGEIVPRRFLSVLSRGESRFGKGSGRLELAEKIFSDGAALAARVIVNRVWGWHFGRPLVATASDFGVQGEAPTHPELLTHLAAEFVAHGWSLKWLNREIMLSAAYQQASRPRPEMMKADPTNTLVWRMAPRRMEIESYRDSLLRATGRLDHTMYGPSVDVEAPENLRRTVYGRVSRNRLSPLLKNYDFPDPMQSSGGRDLTTTSLQQLFVLNSPFLQDAATAVAKAIEGVPTEGRRIRELYRRLLSRDPDAAEMALAGRFLAGGTLEQYAQFCCRLTRRFYGLSAAGVDSGGLWVTWELGDQFGDGPLCGAADAGEGEAGDQPVSGRGTVAGGPVRSEAVACEVSGAAAGRGGSEDGAADGRVDAVGVFVFEAGAERD
jgi:hypothetical protein